jgi:hypothetical protein
MSVFADRRAKALAFLFTRLPPAVLLSVLAFGSSPQAADPLTVQLPWTVNTQFVGFFVAESKGFYSNAVKHPAEAVEITLAHDLAGGLNVAHETFSMNSIPKLLPERADRIGYLDPAAFDSNVELLLTGAEKPERPDVRLPRSRLARLLIRSCTPTSHR